MTVSQNVVAQTRPNIKQINYISKTFPEFRQNLIEFTKSYYPDTYTDFSDASPGMLFLEMAAYVGEVLSFYIDNQFKENLLQYSEEKENIISIAQSFGYRPKLTSPATTTATLYQIAPAKLVSGVYVPDPKYLLKVGKNSTFSTSTTNTIIFKSTEDVDFADITAENYIINTMNGGVPETFIVTKQVNVVAAIEKIATFNFGSPQRFTTVTILDDNVIGIVSAVDSNNNRWYEVDYLAQDVIMDDVDFAQNQEVGTSPTYKLRLRKVPRRFVTRLNRESKIDLLFGSGETNAAELDLILDSRQIANEQYGNTVKNLLGNTSLNNLNFLNSTTFGLAPTNITLTVKYLVGGGEQSNAAANTIVNIEEPIILNDASQYDTTEIQLYNSAVQSLSITNETPATGGGGVETADEIKENALLFFNAQNRVVTSEDYMVRAYSLPSRYGRVAKAYAIRDEQINQIQALGEQLYVSNPVRPNAINLYTLGYDSAGKLSTLNTVVKDNLARYLEQYRLLTDDINILDAFVINIGVNFDIVVFRNYNINDVVLRCIGEIQNYFDIKKWNIGQPIILADLFSTLRVVDGVQTVRDVTIVNKYKFKDGDGYENHRYDIATANINGIIYPSLDPSIFELRYPQTDIRGTASQ